MSLSRLTLEVGYEHVIVCFLVIIMKSFSVHMYKKNVNDYVVGTGIESTAAIKICR